MHACPLALLALASAPMQAHVVAREAAVPEGPAHVVHECTPDDRSGFHGCPTLDDRNRSLVHLQQCLDERWPASAEVRARCSGLFSTPQAPAGSATDCSCGFRSPAARGWLSTLHRSVAGCTHVLFTVILGGSDPLRPPQRAPAHLRSEAERWCAVAFVDEMSVPPASRWRASSSDYPLFPASGHPSEQWDSAQPWYTIGIARHSMFHNAARTAKAIRVSAMRLFPDAKWTMYTDGKLVMLKSAAEIMAEVKRMTDMPIVALEHPRWLDMGKEFKRARLRLAKQQRPSLREDIADLGFAEQLYREEGFFNRQPGNYEGCLFIENREAQVARWSGREPPSTATALQSFECAWFTELAVLSQRTQLSFFYLVDLLGLRRRVFLVPPADAFGNWFQEAPHQDEKQRGHTAGRAPASVRAVLGQGLGE